LPLLNTIPLLDEILNSLSADQVNNIQQALPSVSSDLTSLTPWRELFLLNKGIPLPESADHVFDDDYFAHMRVAGFNPVVISIVKGALPAKFPVTERMFKSVTGFSQDSLATAISEGRVFICDYELLERLTPGTTSFGLKRIQKFVYAPIALFAVRKGGNAYNYFFFKL